MKSFSNKTIALMNQINHNSTLIEDNFRNYVDLNVNFQRQRIINQLELILYYLNKQFTPNESDKPLSPSEINDMITHLRTLYPHSEIRRFGYTSSYYNHFKPTVYHKDFCCHISLSVPILSKEHLEIYYTFTYPVHIPILSTQIPSFGFT